MQISHSYRIGAPPSGVHLPSAPALAQSFLSAVMFWNHAEGTMKQIVQLLLGQSALSLAVTSEMGNIALMNAVKVASRAEEMEHLSEHLRHFCEGFDRLREYRNFYVHATYASTVHEGVTAIQTLAFDGKGQIRLFNPVVTTADLTKYIAAVQQLIGYGAAIQRELGADGDGLESMIRAYGARLEKPEWPPKVDKLPQYLQARSGAVDARDQA